MIVEINATDGDAGLQVFLDGEAWKTMRVTGPDGRTILDVTAKGRLDGYGLTELFSESSEPPFDAMNTLMPLSSIFWTSASCCVESPRKSE